MNKRLERVKLEHDAWLRKNNVAPDQIKARKRARTKVARKIDNQYASYYAGDTIEKLYVKGTDIGNNKGIIANIYKESSAVQAEIKRKAQCIAPLFSKGGLQYISSIEQAKHIGRK